MCAARSRSALPEAGHEVEPAKESREGICSCFRLTGTEQHEHIYSVADELAERSARTRSCKAAKDKWREE